MTSSVLAAVGRLVDFLDGFLDGFLVGFLDGFLDGFLVGFLDGTAASAVNGHTSMQRRARNRISSYENQRCIDCKRRSIFNASKMR
jgi:hypothetical protein